LVGVGSCSRALVSRLIDCSGPPKGAEASAAKKPKVEGQIEKRAALLRESLLRLFVRRMLPLSMLDYPEFRTVIEAGGPASVVVSRNTMATDISKRAAWLREGKVRTALTLDELY
jgi:hypothetical protein